MTCQRVQPVVHILARGDVLTVKVFICLPGADERIAYDSFTPEQKMKLKRNLNEQAAKAVVLKPKTA